MRQPGAKNRLTRYTDLVREVLEKNNHDPLFELVTQAKNPHIDPDLRFAINKELAQYIAPKLRAVEISADVEHSGEIQIVSFKDVQPEDLIYDK